ncbi:MAG: GIY-YIG nuclease family protein [Mycetocola sp.]
MGLSILKNKEADPARVNVGRSFTVNWAFINDTARCYVYEVIDRNGRVVYVGITGDFSQRWNSHLQSSWWAKSIDILCVILSGYRSRFDARMVEALLIDEHQPPCNTKPETKHLRIARSNGRPDDVLTAELVPTRRF